MQSHNTVFCTGHLSSTSIQRKIVEDSEVGDKQDNLSQNTNNIHKHINNTLTTQSFLC